MDILASSPLDLALAGLLGLAIAFTVWTAFQASALITSPLRRRLNALRGGDESAAAGPGPMAKWLDRLRPYVEPSKISQRQDLQLRLVQAGLRSPHALTALYTYKGLLAGLLAAVALLSPWFYSNPRYTAGVVLLVVVAAAFTGWLLPTMYLSNRREKRQRTLMEGLPDALDLLVACTQAGLGLSAAIERVTDQLPASHPELAQELHLVNVEVRAGVDRNVAMRNLAERTGLEDLRGLAAMMTQSLRFGTGVAETLRIYADEFRDRRMQSAEEMAGQVGTKLIFPLVLCIFPSFFVVAVGPAVIGVIRVLGQ